MRVSFICLFLRHFAHFLEDKQMSDVTSKERVNDIFINNFKFLLK